MHARLLLGHALVSVWLVLAPVPANAGASGVDLHYRAWTTEDGLPQGSVRGVVQTRDGYIWIATLDGLVRFDGVRMTVFARSDVREMRSNRCVSMLVDRRGDLWVATEDGGILRKSAAGFQSFGSADGLQSDAIGWVGLDVNQQLWAETSAGMAMFDGQRWTHPRSPPVFPAAAAPIDVPPVPADLRRLQQERRWTYGAEGRVWVLDQGLLHLRNGGVWQTFTNPLPDVALPLPTVLFEDREGTLWIGSEQGLVQAMPTSVEALVPPGSVGDRTVYTIAAGASGRMWITTQNDPFVWHEGKFTELLEYPWWPGPGLMTAIEPDADGAILAGRPGAVFRVWPGRKFERLAELPTPLDFLRDRAGTLWVATEGGLFRQSGAAWPRVEGLPSNDVKVLLETDDGAIWAGTYGGLARISGGRLETWTTADGLSSNRIRALHMDEAGTLWIGTYDGGLNRFARGRFVPIRKRDGLYDDGVFAIVDDGDGRFYMTSNRGISAVARRDLEAFASGQSRQLSYRAWRSVDGMPSSECNGGRQPSGIRAADGTLWFPTQRGIAVIDPRAVHENRVPPGVVVEEIITDSRAIPMDGPIALRAGERRLDVRYTATTFIRPEAARFRHRLVPFESDWIEAGNRRFAQYAHVPPGRYELHVVAANSDGVWNAEGVALAIVVEPYWWETSWLRAVAALLVVGLGATGYQRRVSSLKRRQAEQQAFARRLIESQEAERKRIASELHDGIGQTLVVIRNRALLGLRDGGDGAGPGITRQVLEISAVAADGIDEVRKIAYGLRPYQLDRLGLTRAIQALAEQTAASSAMAIDIEIGPIDGFVARHDEINVYRIVQEGVNNMVRHARAARGRVAVTPRGTEVEIRIEDDGAGFDPAAASVRGGGLGLTGIAERTRILGGTLTIRSSPGHGTALILQLPRSPRPSA